MLSNPLTPVANLRELVASIGFTSEVVDMSGKLSWLMSCFAAFTN
jgi:hypothetical protein